jgi:two-component system CheB/CheR fusion protein
MNTDFYVVGIGASAGGYQAIWEFFSHLPKNPQMAFVIVQHFNRNVRSIADQLLTKYTSSPVHRAKHNQLLQPNHIYVLPENKMMTLQGYRLQVRERKAEEVVNRAIDIFFQSLAVEWKEKAVGIIFSGAGEDGAKGVQAIHKQGGKVLVQEPCSAVFGSMPRMAIKQDHPDLVLTPSQLAQELLPFMQLAAKGLN